MPSILLTHKDSLIKIEARLHPFEDASILIPTTKFLEAKQQHNVNVSVTYMLILSCD